MCAIHLADALIGWGNGTQLPQVHPGAVHCGLPGDHLPRDYLSGDHQYGWQKIAQRMGYSFKFDMCPDTAYTE
jgi:hypothetical protein